MTTKWVRASNVHTDVSRRHVPHSVLLFAAVRDEGVVWVLHPDRGWEVPGGKVEPDETPLAAVHREACEEAGLQLADCAWLAEYEVANPGGSPLYKWVYTATVVSMAQRPPGYEIVDVAVAPFRSPMDIIADVNVSLILKDDMYVSLYPLLLERLG